MSEKKNIYEGCEKLVDGRYRIREKMTVMPIKSKEPITEKIMVEGKEVSPNRKYKLCVWNEEFNGNGRNYKYKKLKDKYQFSQTLYELQNAENKQ